jgi:DNA-directed RNA polymerase specialized sigma24 family protein
VVRSSELVALDDAMKSFADEEPLAAKVVELKYFGGYTDEETAEILEINIARVRRDWTYARAWLHDYLSNV